jgi:SAM-dependent methyltransferase
MLGILLLITFVGLWQRAKPFIVTIQCAIRHAEQKTIEATCTVDIVKGGSAMSLADKPWLIRELLNFPFLPTPPTVIDTALDLFHLKEDEVFADLGCGEGNVLIRAAERFNAFCVGFEIDYRLLPVAKKSIKQAGLSSKIDVVYADIFTVDLSRFNVLYVYPFPTIAQRLSEKMQEECRKGATVLVHDYSFPTLSLVKTVNVSLSSMHVHKIYVYRF